MQQRLAVRVLRQQSVQKGVSVNQATQIRGRTGRVMEKPTQRCVLVVSLCLAGWSSECPVVMSRDASLLGIGMKHLVVQRTVSADLRGVSARVVGGGVACVEMSCVMPYRRYVSSR